MKTYFVRWRDDNNKPNFYSIKTYTKEDAVHDFKRNHPEVLSMPFVSEGY